jgi:hypothetical protein
MDKPLFNEGDRVVYAEDGTYLHGGTVMSVFATYHYEIKWDDRNPERSVNEQNQLDREV